MDVVGLVTPTILLCLDHSQLESNSTCMVSRETGHVVFGQISTFPVSAFTRHVDYLEWFVT